MLTPDLIAAVTATATAITEAGAVPERMTCDLHGSLDHTIGASVLGFDGHLAVYVRPDAPTRVVAWPVTGGPAHDVPSIADAVRALRDGPPCPVSVDGAPF